LFFHVNFEIDFSILMNNVMEIFTRIALNIYVAFSSIVIFTVLILLIHKHGMSFHLRCLCWFLSLVTYDFHCIDTSPHSLNLFLDILILEAIKNIVFLIYQIVHCLCIKMLLIFVYWFVFCYFAECVYEISMFFVRVFIILM
jgi:hypothetical protein